MHDVGQILTELEEGGAEISSEAPESMDAPEEGGAPDSPFSEEEEMELAAEMLEVQDEAQLDEFLGKLVRKAAGAVRRFARSPVGGHIFRIIKGAARKALPVLGTAAGAALGGPIGANIGGTLAGAAGKAFGLELEGLSPEDQEFEVARRFVRFAGSAAQAATRASTAVAPPVAAMRGAVAAARRHAPGLVHPGAGGTRPWRRAGGRCSCGAAAAGRWVRQGPQIILLNA